MLDQIVIRKLTRYLEDEIKGAINVTIIGGTLRVHIVSPTQYSFEYTFKDFADNLLYGRTIKDFAVEVKRQYTKSIRRLYMYD